MDQIKFRYRIKNKLTGIVSFKILNIRQIEKQTWFGEYHILNRDQFTGRKDYHNTEIYEGDRVLFLRTDDVPSIYDRVEVIEDIYHIYNHCWEKGVDYSDISVIGNIYEGDKNENIPRS